MIKGSAWLPVDWRNWLFDTGTRVVEFISGLGLIGFACVFALDDDVLYRAPIYYKFQEVNEAFMVGGFVVVGVLQLWAMCYWSTRSNIISGYLLLLGGLVWWLVTLAFVGAYPPMHTGMVLPPLVGLLCVLGGHSLISHSKQRKREDVE